MYMSLQERWLALDGELLFLESTRQATSCSTTDKGGIGKGVALI